MVVSMATEHTEVRSHTLAMMDTFWLAAAQEDVDLTRHGLDQRHIVKVNGFAEVSAEKNSLFP